MNELPLSSPPRILSPEEQLANVRAALASAQASRRHRGRIWEIRSAEVQLAEMEAKHARGELAPLVDDGVPF